VAAFRVVEIMRNSISNPSQVLQGSFPGGRARIPGAALQRSATGVVGATQLPAAFRIPPRSLGQRLPEAVQSKAEALLGADLSEVRVHVGPEAASIGALAFTRGSEIFFSPGHYNPSLPSGQRLLVHELTHVVQQRAGRVRNPFGSGLAVVQDPLLEAEAERMALRVTPTPGPPGPPAKPGSVQPASGTVQPFLGRYALAGAAAVGGVGYHWGGWTGGLVGGLAGLTAGGMVDSWNTVSDYYSWFRGTPWEYLQYNVPRGLTGAGLVNHLFQRFISYGFRYQLGASQPNSMLGVNRSTFRSDQAQGNCIAYAVAFEFLLRQFGIDDADAREVRGSGEGHFIVRVPNFIDPAVRGHIYNDGRLIAGCYMFDNHQATWVPALGKFYDPMSKMSYTRQEFDTYVACDLVKVGSVGPVYANRAGGDILREAPGKTRLVQGNVLDRRSGFFRCDLQ
jgi:hypothetical protein